jgi:hypothetical protein
MWRRRQQQQQRSALFDELEESTPLASPRGSGFIPQVALDFSDQPTASDTTVAAAMSQLPVAAMEARIAEAARSTRVETSSAQSTPRSAVLAKLRRMGSFTPTPAAGADAPPPTEAARAPAFALAFAEQHLLRSLRRDSLEAARRDTPTSALSLWDLCERDERDEVFSRVRAGGDAVHARHPESRRTPLHFAAASGARSVVIVLLQAGSEPRATCARGRTALDEAVDGSHWAVARLLLWMHTDGRGGNRTHDQASAFRGGVIAADSRPLGVELPAYGKGRWTPTPTPPSWSSSGPHPFAPCGSSSSSGGGGGGGARDASQEASADRGRARAMLISGATPPRARPRRTSGSAAAAATASHERSVLDDGEDEVVACTLM